MEWQNCSLQTFSPAQKSSQEYHYPSIHYPRTFLRGRPTFATAFKMQLPDHNQEAQSEPPSPPCSPVSSLLLSSPAPSPHGGFITQALTPAESALFRSAYHDPGIQALKLALANEAKSSGKDWKAFLPQEWRVIGLWGAEEQRASRVCAGGVGEVRDHLVIGQNERMIEMAESGSRGRSPVSSLKPYAGTGLRAGGVGDGAKVRVWRSMYARS